MSQQNITSSEDSVSSKGLKAGKEITIENCKIDIISTDDSIHSNGIIIINDGEFTLSSDDDGIHADTNIVINNGNITISKSYEGIESSYIEINGGTIDITASDDGINVAGGTDGSSMGNRPGQNNFSNVSDSSKKLVINGGDITVDADGDGLDSNGSIYMYGGTVLVKGPTSSGDAPLDFDGECVINGGDLIAYGSSGMLETLSNNSMQNVVVYNTSGNPEDSIVLKDSSGNEVVSFKAEKNYQVLILSNANLKKDVTYTLYINNTQKGTLQINSTVTQKGENNINGFKNMKNF